MGVDTMSNETVTYSLEAVLTRIEGKIDNLQKDVNQKFDSFQKDVDQKFESLQKDFNQKFDKLDERLNKLEVGQAKLTEKVEGIDNRLKSVEGTQKNQVWTLIILLASAVAYGAAKPTATAGWKVFFSGNP
jgi:septal ring factor EnvC (AmiA/AmiB activator)